jgi:hypothetical protein
MRVLDMLCGLEASDCQYSLEMENVTAGRDEKRLIDGDREKT